MYRGYDGFCYHTWVMSLDNIHVVADDQTHGQGIKHHHYHDDEPFYSVINLHAKTLRDELETTNVSVFHV